MAASGCSPTIVSSSRRPKAHTRGHRSMPSRRATSGSPPTAPSGRVGVGEDGRSTIESLAGEGWTTSGPASDVRAIEVAPDGTLWAMWQDPGSETVALGSLDDDGRRVVGEWAVEELYGGDLYLTEFGEVWVVEHPSTAVVSPGSTASTTADSGRRTRTRSSPPTWDRMARPGPSPSMSSSISTGPTTRRARSHGHCLSR